jgi:predicted nucleic acid-binding protein
MVLVDTSVWVDHFRQHSATLEELLHRGLVLVHPLVTGELACGNLKNRAEILNLLHVLPQAKMAGQEEILTFIEAHALQGKGLGLVDVHLLASALLSHAKLWTNDKALAGMATVLHAAFRP